MTTILTPGSFNTTADPAYEKTVEVNGLAFLLFGELDEDGDFCRWATCAQCGSYVAHPARDEQAIDEHVCRVAS